MEALCIFFSFDSCPLCPEVNCALKWKLSDCNAWPYTYSGISAKQQLELSLRADARSIGSFEVSWSGFLLFTRNYVSHRTRTRKEPIKLKSLPTSSRGPASLAWHASILPSCMLRVAAELSNERALPAPCQRPACASQ
jgi:hypothetical protein